MEQINELEQNGIQPPADTREVGGRAMKFIMIESEPPEVVKDRDGIKSEFTGTRFMVDTELGVVTFGRSTGRKAPRYSGPQSSSRP